MTIEELANKLETMFNSGENKNAMVQLFMIMYYEEIKALCKREFYSISMLCKILQEKAHLSGKTYYTELNKGYKLAEYVTVRDEHKNRW